MIFWDWGLWVRVCLRSSIIWWGGWGCQSRTLPEHELDGLVGRGECCKYYNVCSVFLGGFLWVVMFILGVFGAFLGVFPVLMLIQKNEKKGILSCSCLTSYWGNIV